MVKIVSNIEIPLFLISDQSTQEKFIIDYLKLDIFDKTKGSVKDIFNLEYQIHISNYVSISYQYFTSQQEENINFYKIPNYTNININFQTQETITKKYDTYHFLDRAPVTKTIAVISPVDCESVAPTRKRKR